MVYKLSEIMPEVPLLTPKETSGPVGSILEGPTLFLARDYFRRLGVVLGTVSMFFALQALLAELLSYHANGHTWLLLPLWLIAAIATSLLYSRSQMRRWWRDAGDGPTWAGGPRVPVRFLDILPLVVLLEVMLLLIAALVGVWATGSFVAGVAAAAGAPASASSTRRALAPGVAARTETLANEGFIGQLWAPASGHFRQPAILEFGGSEGGLDGQLVGAALADAGYPTLDIAYFGEPGLPRTLSDIPLEYFARALRWLRSQPGVDGSKVFVLSGSRGSEAALLLGVHYPALVSGVIASSPSDVAICAYPGCTGPAWTLNGRPLPYTKEFDTPEPTDNPAAVIPVQEIRGPVFLDCGGADKVWTSCPYASNYSGACPAAGAAR